jgi:hypothetical protein
MLLSSLSLAGELGPSARFGVGMPEIGSLSLTVPVSSSWSVDATLGTNLGLISWFSAGIGPRWRPQALRFDNDRHLLAPGLGAELWLAPYPGGVAAVLAPAFSVMWQWDLGPVNLVLAHEIALGVTTDFPPATKLEPGGPLRLLQVGLGW